LLQRCALILANDPGKPRGRYSIVVAHDLLAYCGGKLHNGEKI
jgi:hypothetical protein